MLLYCLKCRKNTESKNPKVAKTKNGRIMLLSKFAVCDSKNIERIQNFEERGDSQYIYQNELDKACFQHDIAYGDFKD